MPFDAIGTVGVLSGGRTYLSMAGAHDGTRYHVSANEDGQILLTPESHTPVRPSVSELSQALEATRQGRALGAEVATIEHNRGHAVSELVRRLQVDPTIAEWSRGIIIGAALAEIDHASD